jgi:hypothetical protein
MTAGHQPANKPVLMVESALHQIRARARRNGQATTAAGLSANKVVFLHMEYQLSIPMQKMVLVSRARLATLWESLTKVRGLNMFLVKWTIGVWKRMDSTVLKRNA